jgi:phosphoadenosine phosphosulfate reductase
MALVENTLFGERDKVKTAIERLRVFEPEEGYYLAFSGGKDSVVIKKLADLAGVKYDAHYSLTTVDPPELVIFIKSAHPDVIIDKPDETMWELIVRKRMPPTRIVRYCCDVLKERHGIGRIVVTGVRWAESTRRKTARGLVNIGSPKTGAILNNDNIESRRMVESCYQKQKTLLNPIVDWSDEEVWEFIEEYNVEYCRLYDEGFSRLGCIGCPMAGSEGMKKDFERWPMYKRSYIRAFQKMIEKRKADGLNTEWETGEECMMWWMNEKTPEEAPMYQLLEEVE